MTLKKLIFNVIHTKAKGNGTSCFLSRENDYISWVFQTIFYDVPL